MWAVWSLSFRGASEHLHELAPVAMRQAAGLRSDRHAVEQLGITGIRTLGIAAQQIEHPPGRCRVEYVAAPLAVCLRLSCQVLRSRDIEFVVEDRVSGGVLVDVGRAMPDPLSGNENRQF